MLSIYICEGISALRIYVTVTSPYPWEWGVTKTNPTPALGWNLNKP